jgi:YD repeat-containing protein
MNEDDAGSAIGYRCTACGRAGAARIAVDTVIAVTTLTAAAPAIRPIQRMRRLLLGVLFCALPLPAFAARFDYCPSFPHLGPVRSVTNEELTIDQKSGQELRRHTRSRDEISQDRRLITSVEYSVDTPLQARLKMFPTTVFEFDGAGRLLRSTLKLDGTTDYTVTECQYDQQDRLSIVMMRSQNPDFNRRISFTYQPTVETERFQTRVTDGLTTRTLDPQGRVVKESRVRDIQGTRYVDEPTDFSYAGRRTTACYPSPVDNKRECTETLVDERGNLIESKANNSATSVAYEYDSFGNWTSERHSSTSTFPARPNTITMRSARARVITYW